jgi:tRNA A-37 threonylcarbamoyl transferase component Bud32
METCRPSTCEAREPPLGSSVIRVLERAAEAGAPPMLDPVPPDALADMMLAGALAGATNVVSLEACGDHWTVVVRTGRDVHELAVPKDVGDAAAARIALAARLHPFDEAGEGRGDTAYLEIDLGTRTGVVAVSMGAPSSIRYLEVRPLAPRGLAQEPPTALKRCPHCGAFQPPQRTVCEEDGALLVGVADEPVPGGTIGVYRIGEILGQGQMGTVFAAEHALIGRSVAIKVLQRTHAADAEIVRRFMNEAALASRLSHPNIVEVTDFGLLADGRSFLVMERLRGEPLDRWLEREGPQAPEVALRIAREVALALAAAHDAGVLHNDLKPANVMMLEGSTAAEPRIKLLDFGAAHRADGADAHGILIGSPHYMSPERAMGCPPDARADLYSLGVMLYEMIGGDVPFTGSHARIVLLAHVVHTPPPLSSPRGPVLGRVSALIMRTLAKKPDERHPSARALIAEIDAALSMLEGRGRFPAEALCHNP